MKFPGICVYPRLAAAEIFIFTHQSPGSGGGATSPTHSEPS